MPEDRLQQARLRLQQALRDGSDTAPHREAIAMLQAAQSAAIEPSEPIDDERADRIGKRAKAIAKAAMKDVESQIAPIPEMPV